MAISDTDMARAVAKRCKDQYGLWISAGQSQAIADAIRDGAGRRVDVNKIPSAQFRAVARRFV